MARRTGLRILHSLLTKVCQIIVTYGDSISPLLTPAQQTYFNAVSQACTDFVLNVPVKSILGDETP